MSGKEFPSSSVSTAAPSAAATCQRVSSPGSRPTRALRVVAGILRIQVLGAGDTPG